MFLFWPVVCVSLRHQYGHTYRQGKFKSKIMISLPAACDIFISCIGQDVFSAAAVSMAEVV